MANYYSHPNYPRFVELISIMKIVNSFPEDSITWFVNKGATANKNHPNYGEAYEFSAQHWVHCPKSSRNDSSFINH